MSGGSFDYLCNKDFEHFVSYQVDPEMVEAMAAELDELGYASLAADTRALMAEAIEIRDRYDVRMRALALAWREVEWWRSGDTNKESALVACAKAHEKLVELRREQSRIG